MIGGSSVLRSLVVLAAGASVVLGGAVPGNAGADRPAPPQGAVSFSPDAGSRKAEVGIAACPAGGQRVKTSSSTSVYLVGPGLRLYYISNSVYFSLWDSYDGIVTNNDLWNCYANAASLAYGELVKLSSSPAVYIYDSFYGGDRHIPSASIFQDKYHFSWSKIKTVSIIYPISPNWT